MTTEWLREHDWTVKITAIDVLLSLLGVIANLVAQFVLNG